jgi:hypothetical protein
MSRNRSVEARTGEETGLRAMLLAFALATFLSCGLSLAAQSSKAAGNTTGGEEFFIVSSVDITKRQLLLKEPTEITQLIQVNDKTRYTDRTGKAMQFGDLRAGDTIYIRSTATSAGRVAVSIRRGPMTLEELRRHYMK